MGTSKIIVLAVAIFWVTGAFFTSIAQEPKKIFILHSYESDHVCGQPQHEGVVSALKEGGFSPGANLRLKLFHMDTKRKYNTAGQIQERGGEALKMIADFQPDVLVTLDDNAFKTVALPLSGTNTPVVFCGLNGQPEDYDQKTEFMKDRQSPGANITGVYEKLHIADAFRVHSRMFPDLFKIRVFVDVSPTGKAIGRQIELELSDQELPCEWDMVVSETWEQYKENLRVAVRDPRIGAFYLAALLLKDTHGNTYTAPQIFAWTIHFSDKPEIALNYAFTRLGLFGGAAVDFFAMGKQAGQMVVKILNGTPAGQIAIEEAQRYALVFNLNRAKQLGITIPEEILLAADEIVEE